MVNLSYKERLKIRCSEPVCEINSGRIIKYCDNHRFECWHEKWESGDIVVMTYPPIYHRKCLACGRIESRMGNNPWKECFESPTYKENHGS